MTICELVLIATEALLHRPEPQPGYQQQYLDTAKELHDGVSQD